MLVKGGFHQLFDSQSCYYLTYEILVNTMTVQTTLFKKTGLVFVLINDNGYFEWATFQFF